MSVEERPDLSEGLLRNFRLQQDAARLSSGEEATSSLIESVEQLREFEFR